MQLHIDSLWIVGVILVAVRLGTVFVMTPVLGSIQLPAHIRVFMVLALSTMLVSLAGIRVPGTLLNSGDFAIAILGELMVGALLSFGLFAGFAAFLFGGRLLDMQIGFGVAGLLDPATRNQSPLIGTMLNLLAVFIFFAVDGHHMIFRGLVYSLEKIPLGTFSGEFQVGAVVAIFGRLFTFGLALVAPIVFCLFLIDIGMAVISRTMPQVNVFFLAISVKIVASFVLLAISLQYIAPLLQQIFGSIFGYWESVVS